MNKPVRRVVCAAVRCGGLILCGARHFDSVMHSQIDALEELDPKFKISHSQAEQGFIDQFGVFMDRKEAMQVAINSGVRIDYERNGNNRELLFSEGLY